MPARPNQPRWSRLYNALWFALLAGTNLSSCTRQYPQRVEGSETHFLESCNMTCSSGLTCIDGQCSVECSNDDPCKALNQVATCEPQTSGVNVCQVVCAKDEDCTEVRRELSCVDDMCRGPQWQLNASRDAQVAGDGGAPSNGQTNNLPSFDASSGNGSTGIDASNGNTSNNDASNPLASNADSGGPDCSREPECPEEGRTYFSLPEEGLGTVRVEFTFASATDEFGLGRCTVEFVDDELVETSCENPAYVAPQLLDSCAQPERCPYGSVALNVPFAQGEVIYWQSGRQTVPLTLTEAEPVSQPPTECGFDPCVVSDWYAQLPTTKGLAACLTPEARCKFGSVGCGDLTSALANAPPCDGSLGSLLRGAGCGFDVLIRQGLEDSSRAFYDPNTGALVGVWNVTDTLDVFCTGAVPADCTEGLLDSVDVCNPSNAEGNDSGLSGANVE